MYENKKITGIDRIVLAGSVLVVIVIIFIIAQNMIVGNTINKELFSFKSGSVILIDKNLNFKSPERIEAEDNLMINLNKGIYYWKVEDAIPAEDVVQLEIRDVAASLKLVKSDSGYNVVNSGNSSLGVDVYSSGKFTGRVILGSSEGEVSKIITIGGGNE